MLDGKTLGSGDTLTTRATKVNDGAITQYPYVIWLISITMCHRHTDSIISLGLEQDMRYCNDQSDGNERCGCLVLSERITIYNNSPNDVRNNYYLLQ